MKYNIKAAVEAATRPFKNKFQEEYIEDVFTVGCDEQREYMKTSIISIEEGALMDIAKQIALMPFWFGAKCRYGGKVESPHTWPDRMICRQFVHYYANGNVFQKACLKNSRRSLFRKGIRTCS